ncbi:hypothetical protein ACIRU3_45165 [Streptomyces sp. NPDC101151]|uniref:hypothetical protein n=1 Tax=Streptomyces sp. NPDC101151 TaxID=3366115 RepID=UPI003808ECE2
MTRTPRSPRLLLLSTGMLAVTGVAVLGVPHSSKPPAPATLSPTYATRDPSVAATAPPLSKPAVATTPSKKLAASTLSVLASALAPHGEGVAGDRAVQRSLEAAWPADLLADDERELLSAGRALLRADATGVGRAKWPTVFGDPGQALAPAFSTGRFRIQAAVARRDGSPSRAMVHLVWAGMDRGGTFTDLLITDWFFTRTVKNGAATWTPQPRT